MTQEGLTNIQLKLVAMRDLAKSFNETVDEFERELEELKQRQEVQEQARADGEDLMPWTVYRDKEGGIVYMVGDDDPRGGAGPMPNPCFKKDGVWTMVEGSLLEEGHIAERLGVLAFIPDSISQETTRTIGFLRNNLIYHPERSNALKPKQQESEKA